ncbi:hypothetical protein KR044_001446, partial [Drosophila immigrans]
AALLIMALAVSSAPANLEYDADAVQDGDFVAFRKNAAAESSSVESDEENDDDDDDEAEQKNDSAADDDEEEDDDDADESFIRRRRDISPVEPAKETAEVEAAPEVPAAAVEETNVTTSEVPTTRKPVLVLIRDALNKVTTGLPTEQVANNALQYFQLFQHFIQQTIEQVIDAADDDDEEVTSTSPIAEEDKNKEEDKTTETPPEKQTEDAAAPEVPVPAAVPADNETKPAEPAAASNTV